VFAAFKAGQGLRITPIASASCACVRESAFRRAAMFSAKDAKGVCLDMIPAYFTGYRADV
jgi:hypothetical protein